MAGHDRKWGVFCKRPWMRCRGSADSNGKIECDDRLRIDAIADVLWSPSCGREEEGNRAHGINVEFCSVFFSLSLRVRIVCWHGRVGAPCTYWSFALYVLWFCIVRSAIGVAVSDCPCICVAGAPQTVTHSRPAFKINLSLRQSIQLPV